MQNATPHLNRAPFGHADRLFIDGKWVPPSSSARIDVIAPATEELFISVAAAQESDSASR
jgi:betaine-aldehyde dehydrogenase